MHWLTAVKLAYVAFFLGISAWAYTLIAPASVAPIPYVTQPVNRTVLTDQDLRSLKARAEHGDAAAEYRVGQLYASGNGVQQDSVKAAGWYAKAAAEGNVAAQTSLGWAYYIGAGVPIDRAMATKWLTLASAHGDPVAARRLKLVRRALPPPDLAAAYRD